MEKEELYLEYADLALKGDSCAILELAIKNDSKDPDIINYLYYLYKISLKEEEERVKFLFDIEHFIESI